MANYDTMYKATIIFQVGPNFDWKKAKKALAVAVLGVPGVAGTEDAFITVADTGMLPEQLLPKEVEVARFRTIEPLSKLASAFREKDIHWSIRYNIQDREDKVAWNIVSVWDSEVKKAQRILKGFPDAE